MKRLAVIACALIVEIIAAAGIAVYFLDPRSLALSLAASIEADTGREFKRRSTGSRSASAGNDCGLDLRL